MIMMVTIIIFIIMMMIVPTKELADRELNTLIVMKVA